MFLFSGGCPSAYIKQSLFIHSTSGNGGKPVKKIPASATVLPTMKVEVQSPYNRISISHNRKGHKAFAVFLLSFLVGKCRRTIIGVKCRSPPFNLDFYVFKDSDWLEEKRMAYNNGREDRKCRVGGWKFHPPLIKPCMRFSLTRLSDILLSTALRHALAIFFNPFS